MPAMPYIAVLERTPSMKRSISRSSKNTAAAHRVEVSEPIDLALKNLTPLEYRRSLGNLDYCLNNEIKHSGAGLRPTDHPPTRQNASRHALLHEADSRTGIPD